MAITCGALLLLVSMLAGVYSSQICTNPSVTGTSYSTEDGTVITNVAFISEFTLNCENGATEVPLYAEVNGKIFPALQILKDTYQVSWVEDIQKSGSGDYTINLYDEEGYANLRKAQRNAEQTSSVPPFLIVKLSHPGTYQGPWLNSEFLAAATAVFVWYVAYSSKSKLLSTKQS